LAALYHASVQQLLVPVLIAIGALLIVWYVAGNELMRRRGGRLALWCKHVADQFGSKQAIKWYTLHSFRLDVENPAEPYRTAALTGLTESWDMPLIWLWNRLNWRRDMVLAQVTLRKQPMWGLEVYRPRSVLAGDARHAARQEGWDEELLDGLKVAPASGPGRELADKLISQLGEQRSRLIRLSVRRNDTHLSLALNLPDPAAYKPQEFAGLLGKLAKSL
jgi:hypothetical protein